MRIALVCDYSFDLIGGAQRALLNEAHALRAAGHDVLLVAPQPRRGAAPGGHAAVLTDGRHLPGIDFPVVVDEPMLRRRLSDAFRLHGVQVVHLHSEFGHARAAATVARALGLPVVHTVHTLRWPALPRPLDGAARRLLAGVAGPVARRSSNALLDRTLATALGSDVVISPSAHQAVALRRFRPAHVAVVPNCFAHRDHDPTPLPSRAGPLRVAWIGRCVPEKRVTAFVRAAVRAMAAVGPKALSVTVAGAGPSLPVARLLAAGTPGIRFTGPLDAAAVRDLIAASHLIALTSDGFDNQPMTVVESIRGGRGVLVVDPRLTEGLQHAGIRTAGSSVDAIAERLVGLARDPDPVRLAAAAAAGAADEFAPAVHVDRLMTVYRHAARASSAVDRAA